MIVHITAYSSKHIIFPYIELVHHNFDAKKHHFILCSAENLQTPFQNTRTLDIFTQRDTIIQAMQEARQIILHGIWYEPLCKIYFQHKHLLDKTVWIAWGGEYLFPEKVSSKKRWLFQNIPYIATYLDADYDFIQQHYKTQAKRIVTINYPSNVVQPLTTQPHHGINILVGNSANPTNNHSEILHKLLPYKMEDITLFIPLIYGDDTYAKSVEKEAKKLFANKVVILKEFMELHRYRDFLSTIDIAIFNHTHQEAAGNIATLLGFGAKVCLNQISPLLHFFWQLDIAIYDNATLNLAPLSSTLKQRNQITIKNYFSEEKLLKSLHYIFTCFTKDKHVSL